MKRLITMTLAIMLAATACGLPVDESPRTLSIDQLPQELRPGQLPTPTPETESTTGDLGTRQIHMIGAGNRLETVEREIADTPQDLLRILMNGTSPDERDAGITSAFSARGSSASIASVAGQSVTVDLAPGSLDARNSEQKLGFAQIVFTLTSLPNIDFVDFIASDPEDPDNPELLAVQTDNGTTLPGTAVSRTDFAVLDPNLGPEPAFDIPTPVPTVPAVDTSTLAPVAIWEVREITRMPDGAEVIFPAGEDDIEGLDVVVDQQLVGVVQLVEPNPEAVLSALFAGVLTPERNPGLRSAIPPDVFLNSVSVSDFTIAGTDDSGLTTFTAASIATVDLAAGSLPSGADTDELRFAVAQIVFTLTGLDGIDAVVFLVDGVAVGMPTDDGESLPFDPATPVGLTPADYARLTAGTLLSSADAEAMLDGTPTPEPTPEPTPGG